MDVKAGSCEELNIESRPRISMGALLDLSKVIGAAVKLSECVQAEDDEKRKALELALERAQYEANRARRQFDAVEPENLLVAGELEGRWNHALEQVAALEVRIAAMGERSALLSDERKTELMALGDDVRTVGDHPGAPVQLKKRILRTVIKKSLCKVSGNPPDIG